MIYAVITRKSALNPPKSVYIFQIQDNYTEGILQKKLAVLVGGYPLSQMEKVQVSGLKGEEHFLIAVDGGLDAFYELAILPDLLLGDMDSCTNNAYSWYCRNKKNQLLYPSNKDFLDMEAA